MQYSIFRTSVGYSSKVRPKSIVIHGLNLLKHKINISKQNALGKWSPTVAIIELTHSCYRNCDDCYIPAKARADKTVMHKNLVQKIVSEGNDLGINFYPLLGGEPIQESTLPLITSIVKNNPYTSFATCTNGDYISKHGLGELKYLSNLMLAASIDGFKKNHDAIRGKGSFNNVVKTWKEAAKYKMLTSASITLRRHTIDELTSKRFLDFLDRNQINIMHLVKLETNNKNNLSTKEFFSALAKLQRHSRDYPIYPSPGTLVNGVSVGSNFPYRAIFIEKTGNVRLHKKGLEEPVGNVALESLETIVKRVNNEQVMRLPISDAKSSARTVGRLQA